MQRHLSSLLSACVATVLLVGLAANSHAAMISVLDDNGNNFLDFTDEDGEIDFDIQWNNNLPVWLQIELGPNDGTSLAFSSGQLNLSPESWTDFHLELEGGAIWSEINAINIPPVNIDSNDTMVWLFFDPPIDPGTILGLGDPPNPDPTDWFIDNSSVQNGIFQLHLHPSTAVPEPSSIVLLGIGGVALVGYGWRRNRKIAA